MFSFFSTKKEPKPKGASLQDQVDFLSTLAKGKNIGLLQQAKYAEIIEVLNPIQTNKANPPTANIINSIIVVLQQINTESMFPPSKGSKCNPRRSIDEHTFVKDKKFEQNISVVIENLKALANVTKAADVQPPNAGLTSKSNPQGLDLKEVKDDLDALDAIVAANNITPFNLAGEDIKRTVTSLCDSIMTNTERMWDSIKFEDRDDRMLLEVKEAAKEKLNKLNGMATKSEEDEKKIANCNAIIECVSLTDAMRLDAPINKERLTDQERMEQGKENRNVVFDQIIEKIKLDDDARKSFDTMGNLVIMHGDLFLVSKAYSAKDPDAEILKMFGEDKVNRAKICLDTIERLQVDSPSAKLSS